MQVGGSISGVTIRHSTLVPGWGLTCNCEPLRPSEPSVDVVESPGCITIEHSIIGAILVDRDEARQDPLLLRISDSIVDATSRERVALGACGKALCGRTARASSNDGLWSASDARARACRELHSPRCHARLPTSKRLLALLLRYARIANAAPIRMPARPRRSSGGGLVCWRRGTQRHGARHYAARRAPSRRAGV